MLAKRKTKIKIKILERSKRDLGQSQQLLCGLVDAKLDDLGLLVIRERGGEGLGKPVEAATLGCGQMLLDLSSL